MQCAHVLLLSHWHWWWSDVGRDLVPAVLTCSEPRCWFFPLSRVTVSSSHLYVCRNTDISKLPHIAYQLCSLMKNKMLHKLYRNDPRSGGFREPRGRRARAPAKGRVATYWICLTGKQKMRQKSLSFRDQSLLRSDRDRQAHRRQGVV